MSTFFACASLARREARKFCRDADVYVSEFKAANQRIDIICRQLGELVLINVEKKRIYQLSEFQDMQSQHQAQVGIVYWGHG